MSEDEGREHSGRCISVRGAHEHNLRRVDIDIPRGTLAVVTGVSGSGKSSLAFDTICAEGRRRFLETFSSYTRQFLGKIARPAVVSIDGLPPAVAVDQATTVANPRSTVGTMTEIYDLLRLLWARGGTVRPDVEIPKVQRQLFSFNSPHGACPACKGLGVEDRLDPDLLVADPSRSIRDGALRITTPTGYLIYSQVTLDVLDQVCRAHDFSVDVPWRDLTADQRDIVLNGSDRVRIPYGKHPLESRLRWTGITAKPREEGVYKGILPVMEQILRQKRNDNILRFVRTTTCRACGGTRLRPEALAVTVDGRSIADAAARSIDELRVLFDRTTHGDRAEFPAAHPPGRRPVRRPAAPRSRLPHARPGIDDALGRGGPADPAGAARRHRPARRALRARRAIGRPPSPRHRPVARRVARPPERGQHRAGGRARRSDHRARPTGSWTSARAPVPRAATSSSAAPRRPSSRPTRRRASPASATAAPARFSPAANEFACRRRAALARARSRSPESRRTTSAASTSSFAQGVFTVVTGVSGSGKSTLIGETRRLLADRGGRDAAAAVAEPAISKVIEIDQSPIGRTPRSNPATYTGAFDQIRDLFAAHPEAIARGFGKGRFTFNVKGGRCDACEGAGVQQVGMHFLGSVAVPCERVRRPALQRRDPGDSARRRQHSRRAGHAHRRGGAVLRRPPAARPHPGDARHARPRLPPARPSARR